MNYLEQYIKKHENTNFGTEIHFKIGEKVIDIATLSGFQYAGIHQGVGIITEIIDKSDTPDHVRSKKCGKYNYVVDFGYECQEYYAGRLRKIYWPKYLI